MRMLSHRLLGVVNRSSRGIHSKLRLDGRVLASSSLDVFSNLALEDWIYRNWMDDPFLLLWRNSNCVVIGRHQNPWLECSLASMVEHGVACARRNSGGGSVYHDEGNLNCTFFTTRSEYDRKDNLNLICASINARWPNLKLTLNPRDDIILDDVFKISGTAAKLGHQNAYHHCTVLFNVDKRVLTSVLKRRNTIEGLESKATESVSSPVKNLAEADSSVCFEELVDAIGNGFRRRFTVDPISSRIPLVDPNEETFPGLSGIEEQLRSWDWIFGKSPRFNLNARLSLPPHLRSAASSEPVRLKLQVFRGLIEELSFEPSDWMSESSTKALRDLSGKRFPVGRALTLNGDHWNENDIYQKHERDFIRKTVTNFTSALT